MKTGQAQEFSMDDVLESIRRIISDGETPAEADKGAADPAISRGFLEGFEQAARTVSLADPEQPPVAAPVPRPSLRRETAEPAATPAVTAAQAVPVRTERPAPAARPAFTSTRPLPSSRPAPVLRGTASVEPGRGETLRSEAPRAEPAGADRLMSRAAESAVESAFGSLGQAVVSRQPQTTVEDLVKDLMRPMVSAWLDRNLPSLVERLVQAEIQRLARRD